jgi:hypothetical protein
MLILKNSVLPIKKTVELTVKGKDTKPIVEAIAFGIKIYAIAKVFKVLTK